MVVIWKKKQSERWQTDYQTNCNSCSLACRIILLAEWSKTVRQTRFLRKSLFILVLERRFCVSIVTIEATFISKLILKAFYWLTVVVPCKPLRFILPVPSKSWSFILSIPKRSSDPLLFILNPRFTAPFPVVAITKFFFGESRFSLIKFTGSSPFGWIRKRASIRSRRISFSKPFISLFTTKLRWWIRRRASIGSRCISFSKTFFSLFTTKLRGTIISALLALGAVWISLRSSLLRIGRIGKVAFILFFPRWSRLSRSFWCGSLIRFWILFARKTKGRTKETSKLGCKSSVLSFAEIPLEMDLQLTAVRYGKMIGKFLEILKK